MSQPDDDMPSPTALATRGMYERIKEYMEACDGDQPCYEFLAAVATMIVIRRASRKKGED